MKTVYRIYTGEFPTTTIGELCVKKYTGDFVSVDTGTFYSGDTYSAIKIFIGQVWQIVAPSLLGVNQNYQDAKEPFINCFIELEEFELYDGTNKIYFCSSLDSKFHETEFNKIEEVQRDAVQI